VAVGKGAEAVQGSTLGAKELQDLVKRVGAERWGEGAMERFGVTQAAAALLAIDLMFGLCCAANIQHGDVRRATELALECSHLVRTQLDTVSRF
jgi:hypothetical protein